MLITVDGNKVLLISNLYDVVKCDYLLGSYYLDSLSDIWDMLDAISSGSFDYYIFKY